MAGRRRSRTKRPTRRRGVSGEALEWVGGRLLPPFFIEDREEPYRAEMALWMELPTGLVVGQEVLAPEDVSGAVGRVLQEGLEQPLAGPPRRPDRIRVADAALAEEVRGVVGDAIPVVVAPTPELDAFLAEMIDGLSGGRERNESYLEGGRIPAETVADLFDAARVLYGTRVPVKALLDYLEGGHSLPEFLDDFPTVSREQTVRVLEHAKELLASSALAA